MSGLDTQARTETPAHASSPKGTSGNRISTVIAICSLALTIFTFCFEQWKDYASDRLEHERVQAASYKLGYRWCIARYIWGQNLLGGSAGSDAEKLAMFQLAQAQPLADELQLNISLEKTLKDYPRSGNEDTLDSRAVENRIRDKYGDDAAAYFMLAHTLSNMWVFITKPGSERTVHLGRQWFLDVRNDVNRDLSQLGHKDLSFPSNYVDARDLLKQIDFIDTSLRARLGFPTGENQAECGWLISTEATLPGRASARFGGH